MARGEPLDLYMATTLCENSLGNLQSDSGCAAGRHRPEAWAVVDNLDTFHIATNPLRQLNATIWAGRTRCVFEDVGERPPQARSNCYYIAWPRVRLVQDDLRRVGVLLGTHCLAYQAHDIDCLCMQPGAWFFQHVANDLRKPVCLGNNLFQPLPDWIWRPCIRQCCEGEHAYRRNWLAQVVSSLLDCA